MLIITQTLRYCRVPVAADIANGCYCGRRSTAKRLVNLTRNVDRRTVDGGRRVDDT